ncbi:hypothetical protein FRC08_005803 [Ceratobasidium sp. 394]|nr:hypothetical protein FRC08_005803 [Ceratobasidium sp. 394]
MSVTFRNIWTISDLQKSLITSVGVSSNGLWLASASMDQDLLFVDFQSGEVVGTIDFSKAHIHITAIVWRSDTCLYVGCSDGQTFQVDFSPTGARPVTMRRLLSMTTDQKARQVRALAFDPLRHMVAVGWGNEVYIYLQSTLNGQEEWRCIDKLPEPCEGNHGIVTTLCFFGRSLGSCRLFIGHAMAGFCVWKAPGDYERTPLGNNVSSIGSAMISFDERFIAISSLDQSIVTYTLGPGGPVVHEQREFPFHERTEYRPIVPIALTSNNLIFKGTASGEVPILDSVNGPMAPIHLGPERLIRTLTAHGDKIVVGSSDSDKYLRGSKMECYSTELGSKDDWTRPKYTLPPFRLMLNDVLLPTERVSSEQWQDYTRSAKKLWARCFPRLNRYVSFKGLIMFWLVTMIMAVDPPLASWNSTPVGANVLNRNGQNAATAVATYTFPHYKPVRRVNPSLFYLLSYLALFVLSRFVLWGMWFVACVTALFAFSLHWSIVGVCLVPRGMIYVSTEIPALMVEAICDALEAYDVNICAVPSPNGPAA